MKIKILFLLLLSIFSLGSCIEIFDDLTIHNDGSGTFKYNINLSSSKLKINSILALDSIDGRKVPSIQEIKDEIARIKAKFETKEGISNVSIETNFVDFLFKIKCDFDNVNSLQIAIKEIVIEEYITSNMEDLSHSWVSWEEQTLSRSIPDITIKKTKELTSNEIEQLKLGKYTSITRFDRPIEKYDNLLAKLSASKTAIMLQTNVYSLIQNTKILENTIYLSPLKN